MFDRGRRRVTAFQSRWWSSRASLNGLDMSLTLIRFDGFGKFVLSPLGKLIKEVQTATKQGSLGGGAVEGLAVHFHDQPLTVLVCIAFLERRSAASGPAPRR